MPRLPKPKPLRQNTERRDIGLVAISGGRPEPPAPPAGLLAETVADWQAFWTSALASAAVPATDLPAITRLFRLRDERERMARVVRKARVVLGSEGQPRANPLYSQINSFDAEIRQIEDRFGLTPMARLKLGITLGDAARSLADLNAELDGDLDDDAATADVLLALAGPSAAEPRSARRALDGGEPRPRARRRTG